MFHRRLTTAAITTIATVALTACNMGAAAEPTADVNALYTAAAETLIAEFDAQQTQTAEAQPPTAAASPTPLASPTALPTFAIPGLTPLGTLSAGLTPLPTSAGPVQYSNPVGCDDAQFIGGDPPDGKAYDTQKEFSASWSLLNVGTCTWDEGYTFSYKSGDRMSGSDVKIIKEEQFTEPGHSQAFVVKMQVPKQFGEYTGYWQMKNDAGVWFGSLVWVTIVAK